MVGLTTLFSPPTDCDSKWTQVVGATGGPVIYEQFSRGGPAQTTCLPPGYVSPAPADMTRGYPNAFKPGSGGCPNGYEMNLSAWSRGYACAGITTPAIPTGTGLPWEQKGTVFCCKSGFSFDHCATSGIPGAGGARIGCVQTGRFALGPITLTNGATVATGTAWGSLIVLVNDGPTGVVIITARPGSGSSSTTGSTTKTSQTSVTTTPIDGNGSGTGGGSGGSATQSSTTTSGKQTKSTTDIVLQETTQVVTTNEVITTDGVVKTEQRTLTFTLTTTQLIPRPIDNGNRGGGGADSGGGLGSKTTISIIGASIGAFLVAVGVAIFFILRQRKRKQKQHAWHHGSLPDIVGGTTGGEMGMASGAAHLGGRPTDDPDSGHYRGVGTRRPWAGAGGMQTPSSAIPPTQPLLAPSPPIMNELRGTPGVYRSELGGNPTTPAAHGHGPSWGSGTFGNDGNIGYAIGAAPGAGWDGNSPIPPKHELDTQQQQYYPPHQRDIHHEAPADVAPAVAVTTAAAVAKTTTTTAPAVYHQLDAQPVAEPPKQGVVARKKVPTPAMVEKSAGGTVQELAGYSGGVVIPPPPPPPPGQQQYGGGGVGQEWHYPQ